MYAILYDGEEQKRFPTKDQAYTWCLMQGDVLQAKGKRWLQDGVKIKKVAQLKQLKSDKEKCRECGTCSRLLYGFKSKYKGLILIAESRLQDASVKNSVDAVCDACPSQAISLSPFKSSVGAI